MLTDSKRITSARVMLGWSQYDAADASGLNQPTISNIEKDSSRVTARHVDSYVRALETNGILFEIDGIRYVKNTMIKLDGEGWYLKLLKDVYITLKDSEDKELLATGVNEAMSTAPIKKAIAKLASDGIARRSMIKEGDTNFNGPPDSYRWVPKQHFNNWITLVYGDKVAIEAFKDNPEERSNGCIIIKDKNLADAQRSQFDLLWGILQKPKRRGQ